ncbi:MAG TPA: DUF6152 family protein [Bryobacteraceae bacterium]|jgi:hypothetical protein
MKTTFATLMLLSALPLAAHHSWNAKYDENAKISFQGTLTKVEWMNPHALLWVDVKDANGKTTTWQVELAPPNTLKRSGLTKDMLKDGDPITVAGWLSKDTPNVAAGSTLTMAHGQVVLQH